MRVAFPLATLVVIVTLAGCQSSPAGLSDADKAAIRSASQKYVEMANAQNVDGWIQLVSENAVYMPLSHAPLEGRKAIGEWFSVLQCCPATVRRKLEDCSRHLEQLIEARGERRGNQRRTGHFEMQREIEHDNDADATRR